MTKKDEKKNDDELLEKLEEIKKEKEDKEIGGEIEELNKKIQELENEKKEITEMTKRAQYDYINLKMDFDRLVRQTEEKDANQGIDILIDVVKKFLPFVENLRKSLENINKEQLQDPLTKGVQIVYDNFIKTLGSMNIKAIESVGLEPDLFFHEPVSVQKTEDKKMKGKIIQEFERGFFWEKDGEKKVIVSSKVIVGE
ncbi:nucleotide exchange factor GrpE [Candidatus Gracilibacteria bacterium]|nr:nucleotide exchange factor GrpE [Candidatus Gracilibacteria bacterium]